MNVGFEKKVGFDYAVNVSLKEREGFDYACVLQREHTYEIFKEEGKIHVEL